MSQGPPSHPSLPSTSPQRYAKRRRLLIRSSFHPHHRRLCLLARGEPFAHLYEESYTSTRGLFVIGVIASIPFKIADEMFNVSVHDFQPLLNVPKESQYAKSK
jgi:hypothetical protein